MSKGSGQPKSLDVGKAAHAIRGALTIIKVRLALNSTMPPSLKDWKSFVATLDDQVDYATQMLEDLELLSQLYRAHDSFPKQKVMVAQLVDDVAFKLNQESKDRSILLNNDVDAGLSANTNSFLLEKMLFHLLDNSLRYSDKGKRVAVSSSGKALTISDSGWGIPKKELENVRKPFSRVDGYQAKSEKRAGLGLALVTAIGEELGIKNELNSKEGEGTTWKLTL